MFSLFDSLPIIPANKSNNMCVPFSFIWIIVCVCIPIVSLYDSDLSLIVTCIKCYWHFKLTCDSIWYLLVIWMNTRYEYYKYSVNLQLPCNQIHIWNIFRKIIDFPIGCILEEIHELFTMQTMKIQW